MNQALTLRVPIFPLAGAILFPRSQLPLHIFEPRYRDMVRDALDGAGHIGMVQPLTMEGGHPPLYGVGCIGEIVGVEEMEDGRYNIVLNGSSRFRIIAETDLDTPYRNADVEQEARRLGDVLGLAVDWAAVGRLDDEMLVNAIAQVAPFDIGAKQALLEAEKLDARADLLSQLMQFQRVATSAGADIEPTLQ